MSGYFDHNPITLVKASEDTLFENNVIFDSLRGFNVHADEGLPERLTIRNNLIVNVAEYGIQVSGVRGGTFVHNTIVNAQEHAFRVVLSGLRDGRIQNNLFVNSGNVQLGDDVLFSDVSIGYNGWFNTDSDSVFVAPSDVGGGDPGFVNAADRDFHLTSTSPARDAGTNVGVSTDFEGDPRLWGNHPDIGADEYTPVSSTVDDTAWRDICVPQRMEITGIGMGDREHSITPQTLALADPADVNWLLAQVAGNTLHDASLPRSVTFSTTASEYFTTFTPTHGESGYTFEQQLQPTNQITGTVSGVGDAYRTPRGLVLYSKRSTPDLWTSVGRTTYGDVYAASGDYTHVETLTIPSLVHPTDLWVTAVVIDNDDDARPLVLKSTAGNITASEIENGPTHGPGLTIFNFRLPQVPAGTSEIVVTLQSPIDDGDSGSLVGVNTRFLCAESPATSSTSMPADTSLLSITAGPPESIWTDR
jgi:hypothetical protein